MGNDLTWTQEQYDRFEKMRKDQLQKYVDKMKNVSIPKVAPQTITRLRHGRVHVRSRHVAGVLNKTEQRFLDEWIKPQLIDGRILNWFFEEVTIKLAPDCRYTPDFMVQTAEGYLQMYEIKGRTKTKAGKEKARFEDDAIVKLRISPRRFPFQFFLAFPRSSANGGGWEIEEMTT